MVIRTGMESRGGTYAHQVQRRRTLRHSAKDSEAGKLFTMEEGEISINHGLGELGGCSYIFFKKNPSRKQKTRENIRVKPSPGASRA